MRRAVEKRSIAVEGFRFGAVACGIKPSGRPDCAVLLADAPVAASAVFTKNAFAAAPVLVGRERVRSGRLQALIVNSGNANACTGKRGLRDAHRTCEIAARLLRTSPELVAPASTGVIGVPLPMSRLASGIAGAVESSRPDGIWRFARGISTTDAFPKVASETLRLGGRPVTVAGVAKGAGMIAPDMATLLVFVVTDAALSRSQTALVARATARASFNQLSVDGDTSTNDSLFVLASGRAGNPIPASGSRELDDVVRAACAVGENLALQVAADGEGATKVVRISVIGGSTSAAAERVARTVARSLLVKTAFHGADPNWGRIACAVGYSGVRIDPAKVSIRIGGVEVFRGGEGRDGARERARQRMKEAEFEVTISLGNGTGRALMLTSDLSPAYVRFNSAYTS